MYQIPKDIIELLIKNGADVNAVDEDGVSALIFAIVFQTPKEIIELLEEYNTYSSSEKEKMLEKILFELFKEDSLDEANIDNMQQKTSKKVFNTKKKIKELKMKKLKLLDNLNDSLDDFHWRQHEVFTLLKTNTPTPLQAIEKSLPYGININRVIDGKTLLSLAIKKQDEELIQFMINNGADVNIDLENGSTLLEYAEFMNDTKLIDMIKNAPTFKEKNHNPKELVKLLTNFRKDTPIKYTTHIWDMNFKEEYVDFQGYLKAVFKQWSEIESELRELSSSIHQKIYTFLFNEDKDAKAWSSLEGDKLNIGWSSLDGLEEWCNSGNKPFDFRLPKSYKVENKTISTFREVINIFKKEIQIRNEQEHLENIFIDFEEKLHKKSNGVFNIETEKLLGKTFYTDVAIFKDVLNRIFSEIQKREEYPDIVVEAKNDNEKSFDLYITQIGSFANQSAKDMLKKQEGGDSSIIKEQLTNFCDWSIESCNDDDCYRVNYLTSENKQEIEEPSEKPLGFTHILRFYK